VTLTLERGAGDSPHPESLLRKLSGVYRKTEGGVSQMVYNRTVGLPAKMEKLITVLVRFGARGLAQRLVDRQQDIIARGPAPTLSKELFLEESRADAEQDVARTELQCALADGDPTNDAEAAAKFIRRCDTEIRFVRDVRDAVAAKWSNVRS